jgi:hypothetical protein
MILTMAVRDSDPGEGPWNPGIRSVIPEELRHLATIFRPENVFTSLAAVMEMHGLTGISPGDLVVFRPQRLALHELLIRVTADFAVPDGSRIGDLGINFREIVQRLLDRDVEPRMADIVAAYETARCRLHDAIDAAYREIAAEQEPPAAPVVRWSSSRLLARIRRRRGGPSAAVPPTFRDWGPRQIADCERRGDATDEPLQKLAHRTLARVMSALFATHGSGWGTRDLIVTLATDLASNEHGSDEVGRIVDAVLGADHRLLPRQDFPVVINTKGPSASGKSTLRPLHKLLAGQIGAPWADFALISPDIWRKQLLDYRSLGTAYKYAGAFTADELQIVDAKLDRYMARKHRRGEMTHLLIDRFRFDSFAPDSNEAGSNLLTRFGQTVYLFFMITPPESLVERAWKRGLEFGRYKAVDDTLAHSVQAYTGIPDVLFTWVRRDDKRIQFEFLDNTVALGERPLTVAFGNNHTLNVLRVTQMLNIERYGRVNIDAQDPQSLYRDPALLAPRFNTGFLSRCVRGFREVNFAHPATGRVYLRLESGLPVWIDRDEFGAATADHDTLCALMEVAPGAFNAGVAEGPEPRHLGRSGAGSAPTLGQWGGDFEAGQDGAPAAR